MENRQLKAQIILHSGSQTDFAQSTGVPESRISKIIHGRIRPSPKELKIFAKVFGQERIDSLFGYLSNDAGALYTQPRRRNPNREPMGQPVNSDPNGLKKRRPRRDSGSSKKGASTAQVCKQHPYQ